MRHEVTATPVEVTGANSFEFLIETKQFYEPFEHQKNDFVHRIMKVECDLHDRRIREGLIALGWTPPEDKK